ncbi:MAG: hypothetical protein GY820_42820, partial [Gammaproteobacteria bacterium]|nr:hypothetical protein [Gammaproteobacteria bacterium]
MKKLIVLFGFLLITACAAKTTIKGVSFYDTQGIEYRFSSAGKTIQKNYDLDSIPVIIVLATSDVNLPLYISQLTNVNMFNAEEYEYLLIAANSKNVDSSGYYTSTEQAELILKGSPFKILIFNGQGNLIVESTNLISAIELKKHLIGIGSYSSSPLPQHRTPRRRTDGSVYGAWPAIRRDISSGKSNSYQV